MIDRSVLDAYDGAVIIRVHNDEEWLDVRQNLCECKSDWVPSEHRREPYPWCIRVEVYEDGDIDHGYDREEHYKKASSWSRLPIVDYSEIVRSDISEPVGFDMLFE